MKVHIGKEKGIGFSIRLPAALVLRFLLKETDENEEKKVKISPEERRAIVRGLREAKRVWGRLEILRAFSKDGWVVAVTL